MQTTYHFLSATDLSTEILDSIKAQFKSKPITIIVKEDVDNIELSNELKSMLNDRLNEDETTYYTLNESMDRLKNKYGL
jgi:ATP-dependent Lon protease